MGFLARPFGSKATILWAPWVKAFQGALRVQKETFQFPGKNRDFGPRGNIGAEILGPKKTPGCAPARRREIKRSSGPKKFLGPQQNLGTFPRVPIFYKGPVGENPGRGKRHSGAIFAPLIGRGPRFGNRGPFKLEVGASHGGPSLGWAVEIQFFWDISNSGRAQGKKTRGFKPDLGAPGFP